MRSLWNDIAEHVRGDTDAGGGIGDPSHLTELPSTYFNPGGLSAWTYVPPGLGAGAPLVVVLHGCTQTAAGYDHGTGWSTLADRHGFALLFPEQVRANNPNLCFSWFKPADIARTGGEAESIAHMVKAMLIRHDLDRDRVFVTGLSAGGAMTAVMLATYPELFAGGAIIGGLPYGCASSIPEALRQMRERQGSDDATLAAAVRRASDGHEGPWPTLSLWHGTNDQTVTVSNMDRLGRQWRHLHDLERASPKVTREAAWEHRAWAGEDGRVLVEEWRITGMGHGVPIDPTGPDRLGAAGPYMLDVGISSTAVIARSWGLIEAERAAVEREPARAPAPVLPDGSSGRSKQVSATEAPVATSGTTRYVQQTIERALRSAGLMR